MHRRSSISLIKLISRYPFQRCSKPTSQFLSKSITTLVNHQSPTNRIPPRNPNFRPQTISISNSHTHLTISRNYSNDDAANPDEEVDTLNRMFTYARKEIENAMENKGDETFDVRANWARIVTRENLDWYEELLAKLPESQKGALQRSMEPKIEQLKAGLEQLNRIRPETMAKSFAEKMVHALNFKIDELNYKIEQLEADYEQLKPKLEQVKAKLEQVNE